MGDIIQFPPLSQEEPDIYEMDADALKEHLAQLRAQIDRLDEDEPEDMESEAYEAWGEQHELLEDMVDEVLELLDEME